MHLTHPVRSAMAALLGAVAMLGIAAVTNKGHGAGWTNGTQAIANLAWILMLVLVMVAATLVLVGAVTAIRRRRA